MLRAPFVLLASPMFWLALATGWADVARAERPADPLLALVPADVGVTVVVEDLRTEVRALLDSPLAREFQALPAVEAWMDSGGRRRFQRARAQIEVAVGTTLEEIRDELVGDAVVLALRSGPDESPEEARGLLLTRVRKPNVLNNVLDRLNAIETADGTLEALETATHRGIDYRIRRFVPETKPTEAYVLLGENIYAWANSEELIREVIDRHADRQTPSLASSPDFQAVRDALPAQAVASVFVDPRYLDLSVEAPPSPDAPADPVEQLLDRYLGAVRLAGAALVARDGVFLHTHERVDPSGLDEPLRRWAANRSVGDDRLLDRIPPDAPVRAAGHIDVQALFDLVVGMVPDAERPRLEPSLTLARGLLLGRDLVTDVLPAIGPEMVAYVDALERLEGRAWPPPVVMAVSVTTGDNDDPPAIPAALDNALRTFLALITFDSPPGALRVETRERRGVRVTELVGSPVPLSYTVGPGFLVLGTSAESVALFADDSAASTADLSEFARMRAAYWPGAATFAYADLDALGRLAGAHRVTLAERIARDQQADEEDVRRDLDRALALLGLFRAAFVSQRIATDFTSVDRQVGFVTRTALSATP